MTACGRGVGGWVEWGSAACPGKGRPLAGLFSLGYRSGSVPPENVQHCA